MNGKQLAQAAADAFRAAFPGTTDPMPTGHLRTQSRELMRSGVREHIDAGYFLHGLAEAMEARHG